MSALTRWMNSARCNMPKKPIKVIPNHLYHFQIRHKEHMARRIGADKTGLRHFLSVCQAELKNGLRCGNVSCMAVMVYTNIFLGEPLANRCNP